MNDHPEWNESRYFNFHDTEADITVFMRIGNKPNKDEKSMFFFIMGPGLVAGTRYAGPCDMEFSAGGLVFDGDYGGDCHLTFDGALADMSTGKPIPAKMDIMWRPLNEPMDYRGCVDERGVDLSSKVTSEHFEQFGRATGTVTLHGKPIKISALGENDKSSGVRDWGAPEAWYWINAEFSDREAFNISKVSMSAGDVDAGYIHVGKNRPLNGLDVKVQYDDKGIPKKFTLDMKGLDGKTYAMKGNVIRHAAIPFSGSKEMMLIETISEVEWGDRSGFGIAEFLVPHP